MMPKDLRQMAEEDLDIREKHFIERHGRLLTLEEANPISLSSYDIDTIVLRFMLKDLKLGVNVPYIRNKND